MLPREVQALVVQRVAHNSFQDFYRLCVSCKAMRALADEDMVYASFDLFKHPSYFRVRSSLLRRCFREGNPSALHIMGVEYFFRHEGHEEDLRLLRALADAGSGGVVYLCNDKEAIL
ncbi:hypothetical protein Bca52824_022438 [Brassica carinata]|uniref:F-box domain-containing protein n=1 Tax=Brassica carinata TaxID=52824 RepID=A0A8X7VGN6_BRACI|nr:hypothetical protein Bca52824_022438 [Brassica carinata]